MEQQEFLIIKEMQCFNSKKRNKIEDELKKGTVLITRKKEATKLI